MKRCLSFVFALLLSLGLTGGALAREEIRKYFVDIEVRTDASIEVTETITVNAEGINVRRGIYRDIPLRTLDERRLWTESRFALTDVRRNDQPSPYHTEWQGRFLRILIGDADVFIPNGEHTYTIRYVTAQHLQHFDSYDEIYWNAIGNVWSFPILEAIVQVKLPDGARAEQLSASTGAFGEAGGDFIASGEGKSLVRFELTKPLGPEQGMTIAVRFTKGLVKSVSDSAGHPGSDVISTKETEQ